MTRQAEQGRANETPAFHPVRILEIELGGPLPDISAADAATARRYRRALALVRLHTQTIGLAELDLGEQGLTAAELAAQLWQKLDAPINTHLHHDGLPPIAALNATGLPPTHTPPCIQERERFLAHAPLASIIVATRDRAQSLQASLDSLLTLKYPEFEIIVVDNAPSTTATADLVQTRYGQEPRIRYVREDRPGLGNAHNRGLQEVRGEIVAFTDDDIVADRYWLAELVKGFEAAENVGAVTGLVFTAELETPAQLWFEQSAGWSSRQGKRVYDLNHNRPPSPFYPYSCGMIGTGANMAFRASVLREMGGFDAALGPGAPALGGEDLAAYFEVLVRGYRIVYEPSAIVRHWHRRDYEALRKQAFAYGAGLTSHLTKVLLEKPWRVIDFALRLPAGLVYALRSDSALVTEPSALYPKELTTLTRQGLLHGPIGYLQGRYQFLKARKTK